MDAGGRNAALLFLYTEGKNQLLTRTLEKNQKLVVAGVAVAFLLAAFLWVTQSILSPILVGGLLLYFLYGLKTYPLAGRLGVGISFILGFWIFSKAEAVLFPFIMAFIIAYLFDPVADWLEKWKIRRSLAAFFILFLNLSILILIGTILIPNLVSEINELLGKLDALSGRMANFIKNNFPKLTGFLNIESGDLQKVLMDKFPTGAQQVLSNILKGITGIGTLLGRMLNVVLIPIITFYFLKDYDRIREGLLRFVPRKHRSITYFYLWRLNCIFGGYMRGQLIVCVIVGFLTGLGLALFRIPFSVLLGFITGILNIVPFIGFYISLVITLLASFFTDTPIISMVKIGSVFLSIQIFEAYILSPKIIGSRVGLHPVAVILSVLIFSRFLGFWGLIIGVPTAALIKFLMDESKRRREWSEVHEKKIMAHS